MNNKVIAFPDAKPFVDENDRTMVPVRFVAESMGATVDWMPNTQFVVIKLPGKDIRMRVGETKASVNGASVMLDTKSVMTNDRTYVPLRFVSENLGADVKWDAPNNAVLITYKNPTNNGGGGGIPTPADPGYLIDAAAKGTDLWGRPVRTTNLPKNAADFPYILQDVPNEMYEMQYAKNVLEDRPFESTKQLSNEFKEVFRKEELDKWDALIRKFYGLVLNVDCHTITNDWENQIAEAHGGLKPFNLHGYVDWVKSNQIQIQGSVEPESTMTYSQNGMWYVRTKIKYQVLHYNEKKKVLYDALYNLPPCEMGVLYTGYVDVPIYVGLMDDKTPYTRFVDHNATLQEHSWIVPATN
nr:copper amine oxidase N-terminal domain-containing protein [Tumebacillus amylolyticus]